MSFPYIYCFYSFKGGVGRSLALINVAYQLAGWGRHVLIVDMDLEAPGVSGFLQRNEELESPHESPGGDLLTLLRRIVDGVKSGLTQASILDQLPALSSLIRSVSENKLSGLQPQLGKIGRLDVLGLETSPDYSSRLGELSLQDLEQRELFQVSEILASYCKRQSFPWRPLGLEDFEPWISTPYDYVLVDSRTGLTEIGGLCVGPLSDRLVVVTGLNDQNIVGTRQFLDEVGINPVARTKDDARWDDADDLANSRTRPRLGPKPTILVASPVPIGGTDLGKSRFACLREGLGIDPLQLSYHPRMALIETLFVRDYRDEQLAHQYRELAGAVMAQVMDDSGSLSTSYREAVENRDARQAVTTALRMASPDPAGALSLLAAQTGLSTGMLDGELLVRQLYATLADDDKNRLSALNNWATALIEAARSLPADQAKLMYQAASRRRAEAFELAPDNPDTMTTLGLWLAEQAARENGAEADALFTSAYDQYAESVRLKPASADAYFHWGNALSTQAKREAGNQQLYLQAREKYQEALKIRPGFAQAHFQWAIAASELAKLEDGPKARELTEEAAQQYQEAARFGEAEATSRAQSLAGVRNITGQVALGPDFFNRTAELARFWRDLESDNLLLLAPRRVGKTSLMRKMATDAPIHGYRAVFIDISPDRDEAHFVQHLFSAVRKGQAAERLVDRLVENWLKKVAGNVQEPGDRGTDAEFPPIDPENWQRLGEELVASLSTFGGKWLILVDELPIFLLTLLGSQSPDQRKRVREFLYWMRRLRQQYPSIRWMLAGSIGLDAVATRLNMADTINDLWVATLGAFDRPTAELFLSALGKAYGVELSQAVRDRIFEHAGEAIPYYLQLIFHELRDASAPITPESVDVAIRNLLGPQNRNAFDYWRQRLFEELGTIDAGHAIAILNAACRDAAGARQSILGRTIRLDDADARDEKLRYLLAVLQTDGYLWEEEETRKWRFRSPLLRQYWERRVAPPLDSEGGGD